MQAEFLQLSRPSIPNEFELNAGAVSSEKRRRLGSRITWAGAGANAILVAIKLFAGIWGNSQALIADAVHSLSDFIVDAIVLIGLWLGCKGPDKRHHFGHARIETVASSLVGISLVSVAVFLGYEAGLGAYNKVDSSPTWLALIGAAISIIVKEVLYQYTMRVGRLVKSPVVIANAWHQRSDALSSLAVMLGVLGAQINPNWRILDAYAAILVSGMIFIVGLQILWRSIRELVDTAPPKEIIEKIQQCILNVPGVWGQLKLKVRSSGGLHHMHISIVVDGELSVFEGHLIAEQVENHLFAEIEDLREVFVHVDPGEHE